MEMMESIFNGKMRQPKMQGPQLSKEAEKQSFPGFAPYNQEKEKQYNQDFMENIFVVNDNAPIREGNSLLGCLF